MARPRKYSAELRERAVRLALESDRPIAQVAKDLAIHPESLRGWVRQAQADAAGPGGSPARLTIPGNERADTPDLLSAISPPRGRTRCAVRLTGAAGTSPFEPSDRAAQLPGRRLEAVSRFPGRRPRAELSPQS